MEKRTFQVQNVKCGGCATTLKNKLADQFGSYRSRSDKNAKRDNTRDRGGAHPRTQRGTQSTWLPNDR